MNKANQHYLTFSDMLYKRNYSILKLYGCGDNLSLKLITFKCHRVAGLDVPDEKRRARGTVNDEKLSQSISRSKAKIYELASCNPWDLFFTGTLDPKKYDRTDLKRFSTELRQFIANQQKKLNVKINYILIPELHNDGKSWHIHGLLRGLPPSELHQFKVGDTMGEYIAKKVCRGDCVYSWTAYANKFGFCDLEPIKNAEAACRYITKYITKELSSCVKELNAHLYYRSQGLNTSTVLKTGTMLEVPKPDYSNEYVAVSVFKYSDILLNELLERFVDIKTPVQGYVSALELLSIPHEYVQTGYNDVKARLIHKPRRDTADKIDEVSGHLSNLLVGFDEIDRGFCAAY